MGQREMNIYDEDAQQHRDKDKKESMFSMNEQLQL